MSNAEEQSSGQANSDVQTTSITRESEETTTETRQVTEIAANEQSTTYHETNVGGDGSAADSNLGSFSREDEQKIVKIQAQSRGYLARKHVKETHSHHTSSVSEVKSTITSKREEFVSETSESVSKTTTTTVFEESKETAEYSTELAGGLQNTSNAAEAQDGEAPEAHDSLSTFTAEDEQKIVKIQAQGRGYIARKQLKEKRQASDQAVEDAQEQQTGPEPQTEQVEATSSVADPGDEPGDGETGQDASEAEDAEMEGGGEGPAPGRQTSASPEAATTASQRPPQEEEGRAGALPASPGGKGGGTASVTFVVKPENIRYNREVRVSSTCAELKVELYDELRILPEALSLRLGEAKWEQEMKLEDLGVKSGDELELELVIDLGNARKPRPQLAPGELPPSVEVHIDMGPGSSPRVVQVEIDQGELQKKPYLGGFRHKKTGATYHHAFTQTPRKPKYSEADRKLSRETQTYDTKSLRVQTTREQGTQMRRPGVLLDESGDYILVPGPYMTAEELLRIKDRKAVIIQCALRGWLARRRANELKRQNIERESFLKEEEEARAEEESAKRRYEIERRMHPRTAADFEILYNELEAWRLQETNKIKNSELDAETQHEALRQLLSKETKLLQTIDRLKSAANSENKALRIAKTLKDMSAPKKWDLSNGRMVQVHTPFTTRSKELAQLYNGLNLPNLTVDERLDVLLHVKWTVKEFDCNLTREIVELIDREADLLNRGRSPTIMDGLRRRISSLFLAFIETPEFNPEAGRFQIVPLDFDGYQQVPMDGQIPRSFGAAS